MCLCNTQRKKMDQLSGSHPGSSLINHLSLVSTIAEDDFNAIWHLGGKKTFNLMQQDHNQHFSKYLVRVKEVILLFSLC